MKEMKIRQLLVGQSPPKGPNDPSIIKKKQLADTFDYLIAADAVAQAGGDDKNSTEDPFKRL